MGHAEAERPDQEDIKGEEHRGTCWARNLRNIPCIWRFAKDCLLNFSAMVV